MAENVFQYITQNGFWKCGLAAPKKRKVRRGPEKVVLLDDIDLNILFRRDSLFGYPSSPARKSPNRARNMTVQPQVKTPVNRPKTGVLVASIHSKAPMTSGFPILSNYLATCNSMSPNSFPNPANSSLQPLLTEAPILPTTLFIWSHQLLPTSLLLKRDSVCCSQNLSRSSWSICVHLPPRSAFYALTVPATPPPAGSPAMVAIVSVSTARPNSIVQSSTALPVFGYSQTKIGEAMRWMLRLTVKESSITGLNSFTREGGDFLGVLLMASCVALENGRTRKALEHSKHQKHLCYYKKNTYYDGQNIQRNCLNSKNIWWRFAAIRVKILLSVSLIWIFKTSWRLTCSRTIKNWHDGDLYNSEKDCSGA